MFFTPQRYQFKNNTLSPQCLRLNTLKVAWKPPDVDLLGLNNLRITKAAFSSSKSSPVFYLWEFAPQSWKDVVGGEQEFLIDEKMQLKEVLHFSIAVFFLSFHTVKCFDLLLRKFSLRHISRPYYYQNFVRGIHYDHNNSNYTNY